MTAFPHNHSILIKATHYHTAIVPTDRPCVCYAKGSKGADHKKENISKPRFWAAVPLRLKSSECKG